ncbi:ketopantoate reductase family protein [Capillimicrobium parvum]|uniref:2-dehydropantoate 2-reductase n=1 Tax=Capillimicrobium parvum TaxID=2884022 RepID=A0A9E7BXW5_9ACTN|nr:2-dehydropantoate 2-reductase [Capillimicrobium parvum]UGS34095.1 2-dehydropantoate 2-reductase [Capillimicrobium parvum]
MARVAVLGPGGVGGFVAAALARSGVATTVVARERTAAVIADQGLQVDSARLGEFTVHPAATARLDDDVDVLVVATKATALEPALERVTGQPGLVVPLLNGIDHLALLRSRFGPRAVAGTVRVGSDRPEPGVIVQTSPTVMIELASDHPAPRPRMAAFVDVLRAAEIPARLGDTEAKVMWSKLARLNALACLTAAYGSPIGPIREHPRHRLEIEDVVLETAAVANAEGAGVDADATLREIWDMAPGHTSSMQRDVSAGRESEIDAIPGAVLRHAARHGLECPTIESLVARIRARIAA